MLAAQVAEAEPGVDLVLEATYCRDKVDTDGTLAVRYAGRLHHIGMGRRHAGRTVAMLIAGRDIRILDDNTGELVR